MPLEIEASIKCVWCGLVSFDPKDVSGRRCRMCGMSRDEYDRLGLDFTRPARPFVRGDKVIRSGRAYEVLSNEGHYGRVRGADGKEHYPFFWFHGREWCGKAGKK